MTNHPRYVRLAVLALWLPTVALAQGIGTTRSGDAELDQIRAEVKTTPTTRETFQLRAFKMKLWVVSLQQQGARLEAYLPTDEGLRSIVFWNTLPQDGKPQQFSDAEIEKLSRIVDRGYAVLEAIQRSPVPTPKASPLPAPKAQKPTAQTINWTHYKGNDGLAG